MSGVIIYTIKDIERYHRGEMSATEMHLMEKAALDDPMLADAMEGYRHITDASTDMQALQQRLQQRLGNKHGGRLLLLDRPWLKMAALVVLFAGGGWLVLQTFSKKENSLGKAVNQVETTSSEASGDSASTLRTTSPSVSTDTFPADNEMVTSASKSRTETNNQRSNALPSSKTMNTTAATDAASGSAIAREQPEAATTSVAIESNAPANTSREAIDTAGPSEALEQQNKVRSAEAGANRAADRRKTKTFDLAAEPEDGWQAFDLYISRNRKPVNGTKEKPAVESVVELTFDVDKNGNPTNITITRSLCEKCNTEAIRLLKEGPRWKTGNLKGKVTISFQ